MATPITIVPSGGMVRTGVALDQPLGSFQLLQNARLRFPGGVIEQTPPWYVMQTFTAGDYFDTGPGSTTEPSSSRASLVVGNVGTGGLSTSNNSLYAIGRYGARYAGVRKQVIKQVTVPTGDTINTQCLVTVENYTGLNLTLSLSLDIEIDSATTFRWRKNGGGWTATVPITLTGVSIDSGNAIVWFQATSGFTVGHLWSWQRTDWFTEASGTENRFDWSYTFSGDSLFFCDSYGRVMVYQNGGVQSVGYRPVYGTHVALYENHLVVGNYSTAPITNTALSNVVGWSDLNNLHAFFATDVNEADQTLLPVAALPADTVGQKGICGLWVTQTSLFVITTTGIHRTSYYGLPVVFSFKFYTAVAARASFARPVESMAGLYIVTDDNILRFNGAQLVEVSKPLNGLRAYYTSTTRNFASFFMGLVFGGYDGLQQEVYFYLSDLGLSQGSPFGTDGFLVYQERTDSWYFRACAFVAGITQSPQTTSFSLGKLVVPYPLGLAAEDVNYSTPATQIVDYAGVSFGVPTIETQDLTFEEVQTIHEINQLFLEASYDAASGVYGPSGVLVEVSVRESVAAAVTYTTAATWTTAVSGVLSYRGSGRIFRFRITAPSTNSTTKVTRNFLFHRLVLSVINLNKDRIRK